MWERSGSFRAAMMQGIHHKYNKALSVLTYSRQLTLTQSAIFKLPSKTCKLLRWPRREEKRQDISLSQREPSKQPAASTPPFCLLRAEAPMSQQAANYCLVLQPGITHATETYIGRGASQYPGFECPLQDGCSHIRLVLVSNNRHKFCCMLHPTELESKMALSTGAVKDFSLLQDPDGISHSSICEKYQSRLSLSFFEWLLHQYLCRPSFTICSKLLHLLHRTFVGIMIIVYGLSIWTFSR